MTMLFRILLGLIATALINYTVDSYAESYPVVKTWVPLPNRSVIVKVEGDPYNESRIYTISKIAPCKGDEKGWVLRTEQVKSLWEIQTDIEIKFKPECYTLGEQIAVMVDGIMRPFVKKTYPR